MCQWPRVMSRECVTGQGTEFARRDVLLFYVVGSSGKRPDNDNHQDNNVNTRRVHLKFVLERRDKDWTGDG